MTRPLLALGFVLIGASDWELVAPNTPLPPICATSEATCSAAVAAIHAVPPRLLWQREYTDCRPHPGCRDPAGECISGFNCARPK